jgi:hypothetical protein
MTVSAALYDEYKQLSFERGLFPKGPNVAPDSSRSLQQATYPQLPTPRQGTRPLGPAPKRRRASFRPATKVL